MVGLNAGTIGRQLTKDWGFVNKILVGSGTSQSKCLTGLPYKVFDKVCTGLSTENVDKNRERLK